MAVLQACLAVVATTLLLGCGSGQATANELPVVEAKDGDLHVAVAEAMYVNGVAVVLESALLEQLRQNVSGAQTQLTAAASALPALEARLNASSREQTAFAADTAANLSLALGQVAETTRAVEGLSQLVSALASSASTGEAQQQALSVELSALRSLVEQQAAAVKPNCGALGKIYNTTTGSCDAPVCTADTATQIVFEGGNIRVCNGVSFITLSFQCPVAGFLSGMCGCLAARVRLWSACVLAECVWVGVANTPPHPVH
jgi:hypothetical protein